MGVSYSLPAQEEEMDDTYKRQLKAASKSQVLALVWKINYSDIYWRSNTVEHSDYLVSLCSYSPFIGFDSKVFLFQGSFPPQDSGNLIFWMSNKKASFVISLSHWNFYFNCTGESITLRRAVSQRNTECI